MSQQRVYGDQVYFITSVIEGEYEFFRYRIVCDVWIHELRLTKDVSHMKLFAFCLNYNHFHLLIKPDNAIANYSKIMQFLKRNTSQNINKILGYTNFKTTAPYSKEGDNAHYRLQDNVKKSDKYIIKLRNKFINEYGENHSMPKFKWQRSFFDHVIRNRKDFENHYHYTMYNYLKHELPENWEYTGLRYHDPLDEFIE